MIYSYQKIIIEGPYGTVLEYRDAERTEGKEPVRAVHLGTLDGREYIFLPDDCEPAEQIAEIDFKEAALSDDQRAALRKQHTATLAKTLLRDNITAEIGDPLDLLADLSKLTEFAVVGLCALLADKAGLVPMSEETAQTYGARAAGVLQAIADGSLTIRGGITDPAEMIADILPRYSRLQEMVKAQYLNRLKEIGL